MCCNNCQLPDDVVIYGNNFTSSTQYKNPFLKGRYRLELRGTGTLIRSVEWDYLPEGGFQIMIPSFSVTPDVIIILKFY